MAKHSTRNSSIEALRLVAVAAIAVFHTFQAPFESVCQGYGTYPALEAFPASAILGFISQLGAYANEVFFMISGFFLIESAARQYGQSGYWRRQTKKTFTRLSKVLMPALFYCLVTYGVSRFVFPIPGVAEGSISWFTIGLEFIWVYAFAVALAPFIGAIQRRLGSNRFCLFTAAFVIAVSAINIYIAFIAHTENRGLLSWQKLMSAVTYICAFIAGGTLRELLGKLGEKRGRCGTIALVITVTALVAAELLCSASGDYATMAALSYKSTSIFAFALSFCSLWIAATRKHVAGKRGALVQTLAAGTIGFYVVQSVTSGLWRPAFQNILDAAYQLYAPVPISAAAMLIAGTVLSLAFAFALLAMDWLRRVASKRLKGMFSYWNPSLK